MARLMQRYGLIAGMVLLITLMHYNTAMHIHAAHGIYRRLYYFPIIIAAFRGGAQAGWWTAVVICILYIPHAFGLIGFDPAPTLEKVLEMVLYLAVGLVTGALEDRDKRTRDHLRHSLDEREHLEQQLVQRERLAAVGQLSAGLAHEIRNPLASIKGAAEILGDGPETAGPRARMLTILREETGRLNEVLTRFLEFARPVDHGRTILDLAEELRRLEDLLSHRPEAPEVHLQVPEGSWSFKGDVTQVRQMLLNLGLNAAQAAGPNGRVGLALEHDDLAITIIVTDDGPGFTEEARANLGTPFFTTRDEGTGLGLATSVRIASDHGGSVSVDSDVGSGARVVVRLPLDGEQS